jgi:hypothetical protein
MCDSYATHDDDVVDRQNRVSNSFAKSFDRRSPLRVTASTVSSAASIVSRIQCRTGRKNGAWRLAPRPIGGRRVDPPQKALPPHRKSVSRWPFYCVMPKRAASRMRGPPNFAGRKERAAARRFLFRPTKSAPPRPAFAAPAGVLDPARPA